MNQTYCRPIEGVEILSVEQCPSSGYRITVKTEDGISIVGPAIMIHLRGQPVMHEWAAADVSCITKDLITNLEDDELLIGEAGMVLRTRDIRRR